jgi:hypothetical protein
VRFDVLYDIETFSVENDLKNILLEPSIGYDFGRVVPRLFLDIAIPLNTINGAAYEYNPSEEAASGISMKYGFELGIKPVKGKVFSLIIPLGVLYCTASYEQNAYFSTETKTFPYKKEWDYNYFNLFSGVDLLFQLNKHLKFGLASRIGFPVHTSFEYNERIEGNYIWTSTGTRDNEEAGALERNISIGIGVEANF